MHRLNIGYEEHRIVFRYWWLFHPADIFQWWWNDTRWDRAEYGIEPAFGTQKWRQQWRRWKKDLIARHPIRELYDLEKMPATVKVIGPISKVTNQYTGYRTITWEFPDGKRDEMPTARDIQDILVQQTDPNLLSYITWGRLHIPNRSREYRTPDGYQWNRWSVEIHMNGEEIRAYAKERKEGKVHEEYVPCWLP